MYWCVWLITYLPLLRLAVLLQTLLNTLNRKSSSPLGNVEPPHPRTGHTSASTNYKWSGSPFTRFNSCFLSIFNQSFVFLVCIWPQLLNSQGRRAYHRHTLALLYSSIGSGFTLGVATDCLNRTQMYILKRRCQIHVQMNTFVLTALCLHQTQVLMESFHMVCICVSVLIMCVYGPGKLYSVRTRCKGRVQMQKPLNPPDDFI